MRSRVRVNNHCCAMMSSNLAGGETAIVYDPSSASMAFRCSTEAPASFLSIIAHGAEPSCQTHCASDGSKKSNLGFRGWRSERSYGTHLRRMVERSLEAMKLPQTGTLQELESLGRCNGFEEL